APKVAMQSHVTLTDKFQLCQPSMLLPLSKEGSRRSHAVYASRAGWRTRPLGNDGTAPVHRLVRRSHHHHSTEIVFLTDVFEQFTARRELQIECSLPWRRVSARIINRHLIFESREIQPR